LAHQLEAANEQLRQLSTLDELTGIANRRHFEVEIHLEFQRAMRNKTSLSLIMIDIDNFKAYNDIYGHQAGDDCLRQVATALSSVLKRLNDLVARYGGEEFVVILPETSSKGARCVAESLRQAVEILKIPHGCASQNYFMVTISLGVSTLVPQRGDDPTKLIVAADQALYRSKRAGRNRVTVARI
jgi:diguanylate cyclase (GGDEF)-like protein